MQRSTAKANQKEISKDSSRHSKEAAKAHPTRAGQATRVIRDIKAIQTVKVKVKANAGVIDVVEMDTIQLIAGL